MTKFMATLVQDSTPALDALDEELDRTYPRWPPIYGIAFAVSSSLLFWGGIVWVLTH